MKQPQVSVIISTFNRSTYLTKCLEALLSLQTDRETFEVIVVDNNSLDNTREIAFRYIELYPTLFRYVCETQQGLSYGRNRGIQEFKWTNIMLSG